MYDIEVREWGEGGVRIELAGEFDLHALEDLRGVLSGVLALRRPTLVDLSRVTFLDLGATRELAILYRLYAHHLTFRSPSWQARASIKACGFGAWFDFTPNAPEELACRTAS